MALIPAHNNDDRTIAELQYQVSLYEDQAAYKTLFFILFPSLQNFAFSIVKSRQLAEEIASDIMMELWQRRKQLSEIQNLRLYTLVSVKNAAIARLKQENKAARFSIEELQVEFVSEYSHPDEAAEYQQLEAAVTRAVKELPASCQLIYKLAKEDRLRYKDIAELLQLSVKTIDNQLAIALKKIAVAISDFSAQKK